MWSVACLASVLLISGGATLPDVDHVHDDNVQAFANTVAVARVASDRCVDILISEQTLLDARDHLGHTAADGPAIVRVEAEMTHILEQAIADAPSLQAWCDATYRNYGP